MTDEAPTAAEVQTLIARAGVCAHYLTYPFQAASREEIGEAAEVLERAVAALAAQAQRIEQQRAELATEMRAHGITMDARADAEAALRQAQERIAEHNRGIESVCGANNEYNAKRNGCDSYLPRGLQCPDCPRDWRIDAAPAAAPGGEAMTPAEVEALIARLRAYDTRNHRGKYAVLVHEAADALAAQARRIAKLEAENARFAIRTALEITDLRRRAEKAEAALRQAPNPRLIAIAVKYIDCYARQVNVIGGHIEADADRAYVSSVIDAAPGAALGEKP